MDAFLVLFIASDKRWYTTAQWYRSLVYWYWYCGAHIIISLLRFLPSRHRDAFMNTCSPVLFCEHWARVEGNELRTSQ